MEAVLLKAPVTTHELGLVFHRPLESQEEWASIGRNIFQSESSALQWRIGDWLRASPAKRVYVQGRIGPLPDPMYDLAEELTGYPRHGLKMMRWVAGKYPLDKRVKGLSFAHHRVALAAPDPGAVLRMAVEKEWTTKDITAYTNRLKTNEPQPLPAEDIRSFDRDNLGGNLREYSGTGEFTLVVRNVKVHGPTAEIACTHAEDQLHDILDQVGEVEFVKAKVLLDETAADRFYRY